jgi:D-cysteine desulfhydrase
MSDCLSAAYPALGQHLKKLDLAELPTPVEHTEFDTPHGSRCIAVKRDDISSPHYGGNKIRKLEYIFRRALDRGAKRVATFGAAGSNHALATAVLAKQVGLECTCFLGHQKRTPKVARALNMYRLLGTEIVRYGGSSERLALFRKYLQNRQTWVVPLGGSSWLGTVGFVSAGLELAQQIGDGELPCPDRIYIATGTMGSTAGLALGLAAAGLPTEVHAVCVVDERFGNPVMLDRLTQKTALMLNRLDPAFDAGMAKTAKLVWRSGFLAGGYAVFDERISDAVDVARDDLGLALETTYTGKAMAALLHDLQQPDYSGEQYLFWNTHNSRELPVTADKPHSLDNIPQEFLRYYE